LLEAEAHGISSFTELNDWFLAWVEQVCNTRVHAETGETPIERFLSQGPPRGVPLVGAPAGDAHGVRLVGRQSLQGR
jgi:hypothetical protein